MPTKRFFVPILVAVGVALTAGCKSKDNGKEDDGNGKNKTYESPQEVYAAHETAMQKNDFEGLLQCLSSDSIKYAAAGVALRAMLERNALAREERNRKEITEVSKIGWRVREILDKHGLTEDFFKTLPKVNYDNDKYEEQRREACRAILDVIKNPKAFTLELLNAYKPGLGERNKHRGELKEVKIDGDSASGVLVTVITVKKKDDDESQNEFKRPIKFKKEDGGWKIHDP